MLECKGVVKHLDPPPEGGHWMIKYAKGIPFITDRQGKVKKWCMSVFQQDSCEGGDVGKVPMDICIDKVTGDSDDETPSNLKKDAKAPEVPPKEPSPGAGSSSRDQPGTPRHGVKGVAGPRPRVELSVYREGEH